MKKMIGFKIDFLINYRHNTYEKQPKLWKFFILMPIQFLQDALQILSETENKVKARFD